LMPLSVCPIDPSFDYKPQIRFAMSKTTKTEKALWLKTATTVKIVSLLQWNGYIMQGWLL